MEHDPSRSPSRGEPDTSAADRPAPGGSPAPRAAGGGGVPAEFGALDAAARAALDAARDADAWDASTRAAVLAWVSKHKDQMALLEARVLSAEREAGTWALRGDRDLAGFVGRTSRQGRGAGMAAVQQAATLAAMPTVADALVDGPLTTAHVAQIARATAASPGFAAALASADGQARIVELARRLDGAEFGRMLRQQAASLDPASRQRSHDAQRANRSLTIAHAAGGTLIQGRLDDVAGYKFAKMIDVLSPRPAVGDERTREQRRADALMVAVERMLADKDAVGGQVAPVQALITFTSETWAALRASRSGTAGASAGDVPGNTAAAVDAPDRNVNRRPAAGSTSDVVGRLAGVAPVVDETGRAWPASEIARALCDCALTRAVVDAPDQGLNLGRTQRRFQRRHWLALYATGIRTCAVPGCGMPLAYTELHHLHWWDRDQGRTDLDNCVAYCAYHHHQIHRLDIRITRHPDGTCDHHHPDGRPYPGTPPGTGPLGTTDPPRIDPPRIDPPRAVPTGADPPRIDRARVVHTEADPSRIDPPRAVPTRADPSRIEPLRVVPTGADPPRVDLPGADSFRAGPPANAPAHGVDDPPDLLRLLPA